MTLNQGPGSTRVERRRGWVWNGKTPEGQRFFGLDFGRFAVGVLLDAYRHGITPPVVNKLAVALAVREAMREYRKDKPIAFQPRSRP